MLLRFLTFPLQCCQEAGRFRLYRQHTDRNFRLLSTILANLQGLCGKGRNARIRNCQFFRLHGIVGNLHGGANQGNAGLILHSPETDTPGLVNDPAFVVQEGFSDHTGIQEAQRNRITVELLPGCNAFFRNVHTLRMVIFRNSFMGLVMVVFLDKQIPEDVGFLQGPDLFRLAFRDIGINQAVVDFNFSLGGCGIRLCPLVLNAQPRQRADQLRGYELFSIVHIGGLESSPF